MINFWGPYFKQNQINGNFYITLSGVMNSWADVALGDAVLLSKINNPRDVANPQTGFMTSDIVVNPQEEDAVIGQILAAFSGYNNSNNVPCTLIPINTFEYNSNSFCHGLLNAAGLGASVPATNWLFVGWGSPLPSFYFGK